MDAPLNDPGAVRRIPLTSQRTIKGSHAVTRKCLERPHDGIGACPGNAGNPQQYLRKRPKIARGRARSCQYHLAQAMAGQSTPQVRFLKQCYGFCSAPFSTRFAVMSDRQPWRSLQFETNHGTHNSLRFPTRHHQWLLLERECRGRSQHRKLQLRQPHQEQLRRRPSSLAPAACSPTEGFR